VVTVAHRTPYPRICDPFWHAAIIALKLEPRKFDA
jgi:hypothetical protein